MTSLKVNPYKKLSIARIYGNPQPNHFRSGPSGQIRNQKKTLYENSNSRQQGNDDDDDGIVAGFPQPLSQPRSNPFDSHQTQPEGEDETDEEGEAEGEDSAGAVGSDEEGSNENEQGDNELEEDNGTSTIIYTGRYNHIPIIRWSPNLVLNRRGRIGSVDDDDDEDSEDENSNADSDSEPIDNSSDYASGNVEELDVSRRRGQNKLKKDSKLSRSTTCPAIPVTSSRTPNSTQCVPSRPSSKAKAEDTANDRKEAEEGGADSSADNDPKRARKCRLPGKQFHMVYTMPRHECDLVRTVFEVHGLRNHANKELARLGCGSEWDLERDLSPAALAFNVLWTGSHIRAALYRSLRDYQRVNHFPHSFEITRKDKMFRNIHAMQLIKGAKHFDFAPPTFIMPGTPTVHSATLLYTA